MLFLYVADYRWSQHDVVAVNCGKLGSTEKVFATWLRRPDLNFSTNYRVRLYSELEIVRLIWVTWLDATTRLGAPKSGKVSNAIWNPIKIESTVQPSRLCCAQLPHQPFYNVCVPKVIQALNIHLRMPTCISSHFREIICRQKRQQFNEWQNVLHHHRLE